MNMKRKFDSLAVVVDQREREKERLMSELAARHALAERYRNNLQRLERLSASLDQSAALSSAHLAAHSLNTGAYKQVVMTMADNHRAELHLHETETQFVRQALHHAVRRHAGLNRLLEDQQRLQQRMQGQREQRRQDELASQSWLRNREGISVDDESGRLIHG